MLSITKDQVRKNPGEEQSRSPMKKLVNALGQLFTIECHCVVKLQHNQHYYISTLRYKYKNIIKSNK